MEAVPSRESTLAPNACSFSPSGSEAITNGMDLSTQSPAPPHGPVHAATPRGQALRLGRGGNGFPLHAVWAAREAADKAVERVVNLRQRVAEAHGEGPHGRRRAHDQGPVKLWRVARSWWFLFWLAVGSAGRWCAGQAHLGHARWRDDGPWDGNGESQGCSARFAAGTGRPPSGLGSCDGRAAKHRCGGNGFAAGSCVGDACGAEPVQTKRRAAGESVGAGNTKSVSKRVADRSPDYPGAKYQQIEDSEDELIAGAAEGVQQQQPSQQG